MNDDAVCARVLASSVAKCCSRGQLVRVQLEPGAVLTLRQGITASAVAWWAASIAQSGRPIHCVRKTKGHAWRRFRDLVKQATTDLDLASECQDLDLTMEGSPR